jgi:glycosyltransferase involved in cell wall biosynthesis
VLTYVGRLAPVKNLDALVDAYDAVRARDPRARLVVVGDGPMRAALEQRCPQAVFAGQRLGDDLSTHYASADLFVFPSLTETFGNVTIEAMASGLAVVAFDHAAAAQVVVPGEHGMLAQVADTADFVRQVLHVAGDPLARVRMGNNAQARAASLDWNCVISQFENELRTVIREGRSNAAVATVGLSAAASPTLS